jgi:NitT/TauT family transport system ATP-binding protein
MSAGASPAVEIDAVSKVYELAGTTALTEVSVSIEAGSFVSIIGPSGCGKSTLLKMIAGLVRQSAGSIRVHGAPVEGAAQSTVYVFQDYQKSLFPWKSVLENVCFGLGRRPRSGDLELAHEYTDRVGLKRFEDHYPWQLSGGMQQRVALARALVHRPRLLLMDEPFSSVDALTRASLEDLTLGLWDEHVDLTVILVTHDVDEAAYLADRVVVMSGQPGRIVSDWPVDLARPRSQLVTREQPEFGRLRSRLFAEVSQVPA